MAEEIIDLRDRIEQMRIQIENEAVEQISKDEHLEIHQQTSNSNISLSMENKKSYANQNRNIQHESNNFKKNETEINNLNHKSETFPAVSLSVKNPVSSKVLIFMVSLQILSNIGILYFLYLGME
jgi:TolA-binding protein|tara:strand:+ start:31 stop:405 length:375 start_codon:yes stop_codon:yes gene_type:complete